MIEAHESASEVLEKLEQHLHSLHEAVSEIDGPIGNIGGKLLGAAVPLVGFGAAAIGSAAGLTKLGADIQEQTTTIQNFGQLTDTQANEVKTTLLEMSNTTGQSFSSLAQSVAPYMGVIKQLPDAQRDIVGATHEVVEAGVQLHEAFGVDTQTAIATVTQVLRDYHLPAEQAREVSNQLGHVMATAGIPADQFATVIERLHTRLGDLAPDITTTGALIETLAEHGITGTRALTMVGGGIEHLFTSKEAANALHALGIELVDASGKAKPVPEILEEVHKALFDGSAAAQNFALHQKDVEAAAKALHVALTDENGTMRAAGDIVNDVVSRYVGLRQDLATTQQAYDALTKEIEQAKATYGAHSDVVKRLEEQQKLEKQQLDEQEKAVEAAGKAFEKLGIQVTDTDGSLRDANDIAAEVKAKFGQLDDQTRQLVLAQLFGAQAAGAFNTILSDTSGLEKHREELEKTQITTEGAERRQQTLGHQLEVFEQHVKNAAATIGEAMVPSMARFVEHLNEVIDSVQRFTEHHKQLAGTVATVAGALGGVIGVFVAIALPLHLAITAVTTLGSAFGTLASAAGALVGLGPIGVIILGLAAAVGVLALAWTRDWGHIREHVHEAVTWIKEKLNDFASFVKDLPNKIRDLGAGIGQTWDGIKTQAGNAWDGIKTAVGQKINELKTQTVTTIKNIPQDLEHLWNDIKTGVHTRWEEIKQAAVQKATEMKDQIVTAIKNLPGEVAHGLEELAYQVGYGLGSAVKFFEELPGKVMDAIKSLPGKLEEFWKGIETKAGELWDAIKTGVIDRVQHLRDEAIEKAKELPGELEHVWEDIKTKAGELWDAIKTAVVEKVKDLWHESVTTVKNLPGDIERVWTDIKTKAGNLWDEIKTAVVEKVTDLWHNAVTTVKNLPGDLEKIWTDIKTNAGTAFGQLVQGIQTTISQLPGIVSGIFNQIVSMVSGWAQSLWNTAVSVASSFVSGFKAGLGIHSPSLPEQWIANIGTQAQTTLAQIQSLAPDYARALSQLTPQGHQAHTASAHHAQAAQLLPLADLAGGGISSGETVLSGTASGGGPGILVSVTIQQIIACSPQDARRVGDEIGGAIADALRRRGLA